MRMKKIMSILLALLLAAMVSVPVVSAENSPADNDVDKTVVTLFDPINQEITSSVKGVISNEKKEFNRDEVSGNLVKKYQKNLDSILDSLEVKTGEKLSDEARDTLKTIIVNEHIRKVYWDALKENRGIKESDFKTIYPVTQDITNSAKGVSLLSMPNSLILKQVSADVNGGAGFDGGLRPYNVNGGNELYRVDWNSGSGWALYQCRFRDEDIPSPAGADAAYDAFRLVTYGTIEDTQGFYIYNNNQIEFGNDYDNGNTYGTVVGQHGYALLSWSSGTPIYISNVWNHAMSTTDRNSNMAKVTYNY